MNRYIKAMEIGLAHEEMGISYFDLLERLESELGYKLAHAAEKTFFYWFKSNFSTSDSDEYFEGKNYMFNRMQSYRSGQHFSDTDIPMIEDFVAVLNLKYFLKGQASKQYLDYVELRDSRKHAKRATGFAIFSIFVAVAAIVIGFLENSSTPKPPYDVKVIEDRSGTKELEKENDSLRERLYKAELMIRVYKADSLKIG